MNKSLLIIQREYLTRVRKRTFIISTILFPLLYLALIFFTGYLAAKGGSRLNVAVLDSSGYFDKGQLARENLRDSSTMLTLYNGHPDTLSRNYRKLGYDSYVVIPAQSDWTGGLRITLRSDKTMSADAAKPVQSKLNNIWDEIKNEKAGISDSVKTKLEASRVRVATLNENDKTANSELSTGIGYAAGFLIYFILLLYGSQVMMGVMEEKTNRIAEVIVSSVKPFQLMIGKIIGIGLVALTQFILWIVLMLIIYNVTNSAATGGMMSGMVGGMQSILASINIPLIIFTFAFYLLGGFFFYASLYGAIGSAVNEDMREAQSLSFPITMLVILSIAMLPVAIKDPTAPIAVWGSMIPFSSPIIMMARIPFGVPGTVPWWQLIVSMLSLIAGFLITTWFAGKIYRTGILMYGKKPTWGEMLKWVFRKS